MKQPHENIWVAVALLVVVVGLLWLLVALHSH